MVGSGPDDDAVPDADADADDDVARASIFFASGVADTATAKRAAKALAVFMTRVLLRVEN